MRPTQLHMASGIREFGRATPGKIAIVDGDRRLTFGGLDERSSRLGAGMLARGLRPGEPVGLLSGNRLEYFEVTAGLAKAGLPFIPLNTKSTTADNKFIMEHCGARTLILDPALADNAATFIEDLDFVLPFGPTYETFLERSRAADPEIAVDEYDPFCIMYTSGTTGRPKGVLLTHRGRVLTLYFTALEYGLGPGRRTIAVAPMHHGAGFAFAYAGPMLGGTTSVLRSWDPEACLEMMARDRVDSVFLVPTHAQHIKRLTESPSADYDLSGLTTLYFNAAALPVALKEWVLQAFPHVGVHELYGSTECSVVTDLRPEFALSKAGSVGHPWFMNEVRLLDKDRQEVGPGVPGELYARSPLLLKGYLHDDEATRRSFTSDGFFTVGDVAVKDEEGFIFIVDRKKDMIIAGGVNIYPREIEEVLIRAPQIDEVAVVGVPDDVYGERVAAFVVGRQGGDLDTERLREWALGELARYKVPREWHVVDSLPRNAAGKILKRQIRAEYVAEGAPVAGTGARPPGPRRQGGKP